MEDINVIVKKGVALFKEVKKARLDIASAEPTPDVEEKQILQLLEYMQLNHKDFAMTFPLVLRIMVLENRFSAKAFRKFCKVISQQPMRSHDKYLELQVTYMRLLYREEHPHGDEKVLRKMCADALQQLQKERDEFENKHKKAEAEVEQTIKDIEKARRESLLATIEEAARLNEEFPPSEDEDSISAAELLAQLQTDEEELFGAVQTNIDAGSDSDDDDMPLLEDEEEPLPDAPSHGQSALTEGMRERLEQFQDNERRKADLGMKMQPLKVTQKR